MRISDWSSDVCSSDLRVLDEPTPWDAGTHLMQRASPASWEMIVAADPLADGNREALQACREAATTAKKQVCWTNETKAYHRWIMRGADAVIVAIRDRNGTRWNTRHKCENRMTYSDCKK